MKLGCDGRTQALETSAMPTCTRGRNSKTRPTSNRYRQRRKPIVRETQPALNDAVRCYATLGQSTALSLPARETQ
jgi:hypothetical protein